MDVIYHHDPRRNFGDDLNAVIWNHILPPTVMESDRLVLVGIGSILNEEKLGHLRSDPRQIVVLGTGVSYGLPPRQMADWRIDAVRGPITAQLIGRPSSSATDGAALLARAPGLVSQSGARRGVLFIPHHSSLPYNDWQAACAAAGVGYVSPRDTVDNVLAAINNAELVVTEAMHGAIVADALRVPWVPVVTTAAIDELKWRDWTRSLDVPFEPVRIPPSTPSAMFAERWSSNQYRDQEVEGTHVLKDASTDEDYERYLVRRRATFLRPGPSKLRRVSWKIRERIDGSLREHTLFASAEALSRASLGRVFLSRDNVFFERLQRLEAAARELERMA